MKETPFKVHGVEGFLLVREDKSLRWRQRKRKQFGTSYAYSFGFRRVGDGLDGPTWLRQMNFRSGWRPCPVDQVPPELAILLNFVR